MNFDFSQIIRSLGADYAFTIANGAIPPASYLFATLLPEIKKANYTAKSGIMTVRSTMAQAVGMDAPYPPTGIIEGSTFENGILKMANEVPISEMALRELQQLMQSLGGGGGTPINLADEALNFLNKVIIQAHLDAAEQLRAQALLNGKIDMISNQKRIVVDYGVPSGNFLPARTGANGYGGSTSKFWADIALLKKTLKNNVRVIIAHPDTIDVIISNTANSLAVLEQGDNGVTIQKYSVINGLNLPSSDARERIQLVSYWQEAEAIDTDNPGKSRAVKFMPAGKLLAVGNNSSNGYQPGMGSTVDPLQALSLGYTHLGPTTEGGNRPGRWAELFTPERLPMQIAGRGVTNILPVIEAPGKIAVATTEMPS